ncbi:hypothetical protein WA026_018363 [Henosepilachna vigintioctopunctata]|uniref:Uncharacterized protein n=1 Tax=Henosepilachna vigintioctopunctata TaxID=420089 RepID=A0AAW1VFS5_9CUCU
MYEHQGCEFKGKGATLVDQQTVCEYVSALCIIKPCPWKGRQRELSDLFQTDQSEFMKIYGPNDKEICITFGKGGTVYAHMIKAFGKFWRFSDEMSRNVSLYCNEFGTVRCH